MKKIWYFVLGVGTCLVLGAAYNPGPSEIGDGVRVSRTSTQSIPNSTWTAINFNAADTWDDNDLHDTVTNNERLTAQVAGRYIFIVTWRWGSNATGARMGRILKNGSATEVAAHGRGGSSDSFQQRFTMSGMAELAATDYIEFQVWQNSGGALNVTNSNDDAPRFMMQRLKD